MSETAAGDWIRGFVGMIGSVVEVEASESVLGVVVLGDGLETSSKGLAWVREGSTTGIIARGDCSVKRSV